MIRKRRWTVIAVFILVFTTVLVGTLEEKPVYRANALIEIERENPSLVTSQQVLQLDDASDAYLETQYKILNSEDLADRVIDQLGRTRLRSFGLRRDPGNCSRTCHSQTIQPRAR